MNKPFELAAAVEATLDFLIKQAKNETWEGFIFTYLEDAEVFRSHLTQLRALSDDILCNTREIDNVG
jgi:hypothetical protein